MHAAHTLAHLCSTCSTVGATAAQQRSAAHTLAARESTARTVGLCTHTSPTFSTECASAEIAKLWEHVCFTLAPLCFLIFSVAGGGGHTYTILTASLHARLLVFSTSVVQSPGAEISNSSYFCATLFCPSYRPAWPLE